jgi:hypothetical protein
MPTKEFAKVQKKTFTRWVNERYLSANKHHPKTKEICEVKDFAEFKDGILLCCLMELLTKTKLRYNKKVRCL